MEDTTHTVQDTRPVARAIGWICSLFSLNALKKVISVGIRASNRRHKDWAMRATTAVPVKAPDVSLVVSPTNERSVPRIANRLISCFLYDVVLT